MRSILIDSIVRGDRHDGRKFRGYGWNATLELLSPPATANSRQHFKLVICPACGLVHEIGGKCLISRHRHNKTPFNGYLDGPTLWNKSLTQGEIKALNYLDRGLNGIVVPRGLFFQSEFFEYLNKSSLFVPGNPLLGSIAMGNDNPRELNSRVVQQLIAANLTLLEAWTWIHNLTRNESGNVTSFPLVVTDETCTLGLDPMVLNVLPNVTVENSGNHSEPPPPRQTTTTEQGLTHTPVLAAHSRSPPLIWRLSRTRWQKRTSPN